MKAEAALMSVLLLCYQTLLAVRDKMLARQIFLLTTAVMLPSTVPGADWKTSLSLHVCQCFKDGPFIHALPVCQAGPSVSSHSYTLG